MSATMWEGTWPASPGATTRLPTGTSTTATQRIARKTPVRRSIRASCNSGLHRTAALRKEPARPLLDEQDDEDEDEDLAEHRAGVGLEELVGDPEREGGGEGAPEVAGAAEHNDEERVDDVALPEVRRHVVDL